MKHRIVNTILGPGQLIVQAIRKYGGGGDGAFVPTVPHKPKPTLQHWARIKQLEHPNKR